MNDGTISISSRIFETTAIFFNWEWCTCVTKKTVGAFQWSFLHFLILETNRPEWSNANRKWESKRTPLILIVLCSLQLCATPTYESSQSRRFGGVYFGKNVIARKVSDLTTQKLLLRCLLLVGSCYLLFVRLYFCFAAKKYLYVGCLKPTEISQIKKFH